MDILNAEKFPTKNTMELRNLTKKLKIPYGRLVICSKYRTFRKRSTDIYRISRVNNICWRISIAHEKNETLLQPLRVWTEWRKLWKFPRKYWDFLSVSPWHLIFHNFSKYLRLLTLPLNYLLLEDSSNFLQHFSGRGHSGVPSPSRHLLILENIYAILIFPILI